MKVINTFTKGAMNKSTDKSLIPQDYFIDAENLRFSTTNNNDGVGTSIKGSLQVSDSTEGNNDYKCISAIFNRKKDTILYLLATTDGLKSKILEFNTVTEVTATVINDVNGLLKFDKSGYITGINIIDDLLIISEWNNNIRKINIERHKQYEDEGKTALLSEEDITLIVKPPYNKPLISLQNTTTSSEDENNLEEKLIYFSYRWRYLDGEYSALAPFSLPAFEPKTFDYDFSTQSNKSMINKYNQVEISFDTGSENVTEIQLVFKESGDNEVFIINDFVKEYEDNGVGWGNNETKTFTFDNFNGIRGLSSDELNKRFDNIPRSSKCQTVIDGRLLFANYKENYNLLDSLGEKVKVDYTLEIESISNTVIVERDDYNENNELVGTVMVEVPSLIPKKTCRSNRDLEVVIEYLDEYLRPTTLLNSSNNTIYIPSSLSTYQNKVNVLLKNKPPSFAKYFRFFVKQTKTDYEQVIPTLFYEDGVYVWVKIESSEINKIKEGDFLIIKADTKGIVNSTVKAKVLELKYQEADFLGIEDETQVAGTYFKVKPGTNFSLEFDDLELTELIQPHISRAGGNVRDTGISTSIQDYISEAHHYGSGLNDMKSNSSVEFSGIYSGSGRSRYTIQIDGVSIPNSFVWYENDLEGNTTTHDSQNIQAGVFVDLSNGVQIKFDSEVGHTLNDTWNINGRNVWNLLQDSRSYNAFKISESKNSEKIYSGARIKLTYSEFGRGSEDFVIENTSSAKYDNIEEWFHKENIIDLITANSNVEIDDIHFYRGYYQSNQDNNASMTMVIRSLAHGTWLEKVKSKGVSEILNNSEGQIILIETEPKENPSDIFYEIGKTYKIENGYHLGGGGDDINQSSGIDLKVTLDWYNAFSYGNGVESYKIRDEFNANSIDTGTRVSSISKEEYKETIRTEDVSWTDVYSNDGTFNGLSSSNLSLANFITLDRENGSIQKIYNKNGNLMILQEDGIGRIPYNKNIIYDTQGGSVVGISTNILNKESYFSYDAGKHGISKEPESFVSDGFRDYFTDKQRGVLIRLSTDGVTPISQNFYQNEFSSLMIANKDNKLLGGFDVKHQEYLLHVPSENKSLSFKELSKGFPNKFTFEPDFMLSANNELYCWKNGVMYKMNSTENYNNFFGEQYESKIKFVVNHEFGFEKIFKAMGLYSNKAWLANLQTSLSSRQIPKSSFRKMNNYWFSEIMGDTSDNILNNSIFGIGSYEVNNGVIQVLNMPPSISVGDYVKSKTHTFPISKTTSTDKNKVIGVNYQTNEITLELPSTLEISFLMYEKNQNIDGGNIKGDFMEVELISDETTLVEIKAVKTEVGFINEK